MKKRVAAGGGPTQSWPLRLKQKETASKVDWKEAGCADMCEDVLEAETSDERPSSSGVAVHRREGGDVQTACVAFMMVTGTDQELVAPESDRRWGRRIVRVMAVMESLAM